MDGRCETKFQIVFDRGQKSNTNFFFSNLSGTPGYPGKIPDIPPKKFGFPGFHSGHTELFGPLYVEEPHPNGRYPDPKV